MSRRFAWAIVCVVLTIAVMGIPAAAGSAGFQLVDNYNFEDGSSGGVPEDWTIVGGNGDKVKCIAPREARAADPTPYSPNCHFMFKGGPTATSLRYKTPASYLNEVNAILNNCTAFDVYATLRFFSAQNTTLKLRTTVTYTAAGTKYETKISETVGSTIGAWAFVGNTTVRFPANAEVTKLAIQLQHNAPSGKAFVDNVSLEGYPQLVC